MFYDIRYQAGKRWIVYLNGRIYQDQIPSHEEAESVIIDLVLDYRQHDCFDMRLIDKEGNC